jgi:hypothetical protein
MALWGNKDSFSDLTGTVTVDYDNKVITGTGTTFVTAGISTGDVISIGVGNTFGSSYFWCYICNTNLNRFYSVPKW